MDDDDVAPRNPKGNKDNKAAPKSDNYVEVSYIFFVYI